MATLAFGQVGECVVFMCGVLPLNDKEWMDYLRFVERVQGNAARRPNLVLAEGSGPDSRQRAQLRELLQHYGNTIRVAVVTASTMARGIVTAIGWFSQGYRAFAPHELDAALRYLAVTNPADIAGIKDMVQRLKTQLMGAQPGAAAPG